MTVSIDHDRNGDTMTEQLLTPTEAGALLAMTKGALAQLRYLGAGPKFVRVSGRSVRYRHEDLDEWIAVNLHAPTGAHR